jgi:hypothetical protein
MWSTVVGFMHSLLYPQWKAVLALNRRLGGPKSNLGIFKKKYFLVSTGYKP